MRQIQLEKDRPWDIADILYARGEGLIPAKYVGQLNKLINLEAAVCQQATSQ